MKSHEEICDLVYGGARYSGLIDEIVKILDALSSVESPLMRELARVDDLRLVKLRPSKSGHKTVITMSFTVDSKYRTAAFTYPIWDLNHINGFVDFLDELLRVTRPPGSKYTKKDNLLSQLCREVTGIKIGTRRYVVAIAAVDRAGMTDALVNAMEKAFKDSERLRLEQEKYVKDKEDVLRLCIRDLLEAGYPTDKIDQTVREEEIRVVMQS